MASLLLLLLLLLEDVLPQGPYCCPATLLVVHALHVQGAHQAAHAGLLVSSSTVAQQLDDARSCIIVCCWCCCCCHGNFSHAVRPNCCTLHCLAAPLCAPS
jgi:hypothetical protein